MPIYVYECQKCKQQWEYMQSVKDAPKKKCEKCSGKLEKIIAPTAFVLKGGGWYKDLYSSSKPSASGSESGSGSGESKGESKGEAKSAASESKGTSKAESKSESKGAKGGKK